MDGGLWGGTKPEADPFDTHTTLALNLSVSSPHFLAVRQSV